MVQLALARTEDIAHPNANIARLGLSICVPKTIKIRSKISNIKSNTNKIGSKTSKIRFKANQIETKTNKILSRLFALARFQ